MGLTEEGEVYAWGRNDDCQLGFLNQGEDIHCEEPRLVEGFDEKVEGLSVGGHYSYAVTEENRLYSW